MALPGGGERARGWHGRARRRPARGVTGYGGLCPLSGGCSHDGPPRRRLRAFNRRWTRLVGLLDEGLLETEHTLPEAGRALRARPRRERRAVAPARVARARRQLPDAAAGPVDRAGGLAASAPSAGDGQAPQRRADRAGGARRSRRSTPRAEAQVRALLAPLGETTGARTLVGVARSRLAPDGRGLDAARGAPARHAPRGSRLGRAAPRRPSTPTSQRLRRRASRRSSRASSPTGRRDGTRRARARGSPRSTAVRAGSVFCCASDEAAVAKLRILLVERWWRAARGVGAALVDACTGFARNAGYRRVTALDERHARRGASALRSARGFRLVDEAPHRSFGIDLVGADLGARPRRLKGPAIGARPSTARARSRDGARSVTMRAPLAPSAASRHAHASPCGHLTPDLPVSALGPRLHGHERVLRADRRERVARHARPRRRARLHLPRHR